MVQVGAEMHEVEEHQGELLMVFQHGVVESRAWPGQGYQLKAKSKAVSRAKSKAPALGSRLSGFQF